MSDKFTATLAPGIPIPGPEGPAGAPGQDGADGAPGADGATGPPGPEGPRGASGEDGATGATGPAGQDGATGPQGTPGPSSALGLGSVDAGGVMSGPPGWSCQHALLGKYVVVHNLHLDPAAYIVLATLTGPPAAVQDPLAQPSPSFAIAVDAQTADSFTIKCYQGVSPQNAAFNFGMFR